MIRIEEVSYVVSNEALVPIGQEIECLLASVDELARACHADRRDFVVPLVRLIRRRATFENLKNRFDVRRLQRS